MKEKLFLHVCFGLLLTLASISCNKTAEIGSKQSIDFVNEAKRFVDNNLIVSNKISRINDSRTALEKSFIWNHIIASRPDETQIIEVPIEYKSNLYIKRLNGRISISTQDMSKLLVYRDYGGNLHAEIVTKIPDDDYLSNAANQKNFSGTIYVEDLNGNFLKGFVYADRKVTRISSISHLNTVQSQKVAPDGCGGTVDWYSCASGDGGASWSCTYSHSSPANCAGSGGEFPDRGPRIEYVNTSGSEGHPSSGGAINSPNGPATPGSAGSNRWPGDIKCTSFKFVEYTNNNMWTAGLILRSPSFGSVGAGSYKEFQLKPIIIEVPIQLRDGTMNTSKEAAESAAAAMNTAVKTLGLMYGKDMQYMDVLTSTYAIKFRELVETYLKADLAGSRVSYEAPLNKRPGLIFYPSEHQGLIDGLLNMDGCD